MGIVEMKKKSSKQWSSLCNIGWNIRNANIVCRELGFERANSFYKRPIFGHALSPVNILPPACSPTASKLSDCRIRNSKRRIKKHCNQRKYASVFCI